MNSGVNHRSCAAPVIAAMPCSRRMASRCLHPLALFRGAAGHRAEQHQPAHAVRVLQRDALRDHAAQREPHDVRGGHRAGIQHVDDVADEVVERQRAVDVSGPPMPAQVEPQYAERRTRGRERSGPSSCRPRRRRGSASPAADRRPRPSSAAQARPASATSARSLRRPFGGMRRLGPKRRTLHTSIIGSMHAMRRLSAFLQRSIGHDRSGVASAASHEWSPWRRAAKGDTYVCRHRDDCALAPRKTIGPIAFSSDAGC